MKNNYYKENKTTHRVRAQVPEQKTRYKITHGVRAKVPEQVWKVLRQVDEGLVAEIIKNAGCSIKKTRHKTTHRVQAQVPEQVWKVL
eukprot:1130654-Pelagomonas_calceolata.AAC.3